MHCRSNFSFLSGASHPEELIAAARDRRYSALAITDECSFAGVVRAHVEALQQQEQQQQQQQQSDQPPQPSLKLIIGAEMRLDASPAPSSSPAELRPLELDPLDPLELPPAAPPAAGMRLVLLVQSHRGYVNLSRWISIARCRAAKGTYQAHASDLEGRIPSAPFLAGLPGCLALLVLDGTLDFATQYAQACWLRNWFGGDRAWLAVSQLRRVHDRRLVRLARRLAAATGLGIVATGDVTMHSRSRKPLLDVLTATRLKQTVADCGDALAPNAERYLRSRQRLAALYPAEWMEAAAALAERCNFSLAELRYQYPREIVPDGETPATWLRELTERGLRERFPDGPSTDVRATIEKELELIGRLQYEAYFLTIADIVHWARSQGILCQGRGSAANSLVCYCLRVTEVDPRRATLLFERFVSAERNEPPDIDVDFEHQRREEVIQYIYRKYGRHRAALTAVVISYRPRSALRDVGRALGFDLDRIAAVSKGQHWFDGRHIAPERLRENGIDPDSALCRHWMAITRELIGFPRHLSQHPGGFLIARDEIAQVVPIENATMENRTVIQWDKDDLDSLRLLKVDILALGMLSAIRRAMAFVEHKTGRPHEIATLMNEADDPVVYDMLCRGDSVGVFQVESRAQMSMLPRLKPRCYYDLVIEVAIVRPGPIQGGMVHPFLRRRNGEEPADIPRPELLPALGRTKGVPIFQEQVMQIAMIAAEFTAGEADQLRRAMAAWKRKGGLGPFYERLVERMVHRGYELEFAERIFKQIEGFGEYGFPESHAASFALLVYVSAWLKCHHPDAFLAALLNSQPMGFYAPAQLVRDAREHGVEVRPVDVLRSEWDSVLEIAAPSPGESRPLLQPVRLGLSRLTGFREQDALRLVAARAEGPFAGVEDLARRAALDEHALRLLAQGDALGGLLAAAAAGHRHQAAWAVRGIDTHATALLQSTRTLEEAARLAAPSLGEDVVADYQATRLSLKAHPVALLREQLAAFKVQPAAVLKFYRHGQLARASGLVTHRQRPETAKGVIFVTLEDDTGAVNVIVWPAVAEAQRQALLASRLLTVYGVWQREGEVRHLVAQRLVDHSALLNGLEIRSRDFH
nr:error-prone DNA polymerase [Aquabacterium terrae]